MNAIGNGSRFTRCLAVLVVTILMAACGGGGGGGSVQEEISVGITTQGGATTVPSGGTLGMVAQVNNATNTGVTWSLTGPGCPASCGTLSPSGTGATYVAPSNVPAQFSVTITATSAQNPAKSASITLTIQARVCAAGTALLNGAYAFQLQGFEVSGGNGVAAVGSFTADGCGNITAGEADYDLGPAAAGHTTSLSGTYTIGDDNRGTVNLTVGSLSKSFAVALGRIANGIAGKGSLVEMGTNPATTVMSGPLWRQDASAFTLGAVAGPYAFVLNGWNGSGPREAMGGTVQADGAGHLANGLLDSKRFGSAPVLGTAWTGSIGTPSGTGRSALTAPTLTGASATGVSYVVNPEQLIVLIADPTAPGRVLSGSMVAQHGPFGLGSMTGKMVAYQTANYDQSGYTMMTMSVLTMVSADAAGHLTLSVDVNSGGNVSTASSGAYTYNVTPDGQASIYVGPSTLGGKWYLTAPNTALMLGFDTGVSIGAILPQSDGPFTAAALNGSYFGTQAPGGAYGSMQASGVASSSGGGTLSTVLDVNRHGAALWHESASGGITVDASGRATDTQGNVIYLVSPTKFVMMSIDVTNFYPVVEVFER